MLAAHAARSSRRCCGRRTRAGCQRRQCCARSVTLVLAEQVSGIGRSSVGHQRIARALGEDRCRADRRHAARRRASMASQRSAAVAQLRRQRLPSTCTSVRAATAGPAARGAWRAAWRRRMFRLSISSTSAQAIDQASARSRIRMRQRFALRPATAAWSRAGPRSGARGSSITAAAYTGPASGPRPASSTPADATTRARHRPGPTLQPRCASPPARRAAAPPCRSCSWMRPEAPLQAPRRASASSSQRAQRVGERRGCHLPPGRTPAPALRRPAGSAARKSLTFTSPRSRARNAVSGASR